MSSIARSAARPREGSSQPSPISRGSGTVARLVASAKQTHERLRREHMAYAIVVEIAESFQKHQPGLLARQAAYSLLYAIPSILLVLVSLAVIVDRNTDFGVSAALQEFIAAQSPDDAQPVLASLLQSAIARTSENAAIVAAAVSLAIAVWGAAGGVGALMYSVNQVYAVRDTRSFVKATVTRLGLMILGGVLVVGAFVLLTFGRRIADWLATGPADLDPAVTGLLTSGPIWSLGLLFASLLLLYWFSLDLPKSPRWLLPGAALAALAAAVIFALIDVILSISNPGAAFGAAGGVLVLLWAIFIVSQVVVIGAIVNAVLGHRYDATLRAALAQHPEKRLDLCHPNEADAVEPGIRPARASPPPGITPAEERQGQPGSHAAVGRPSTATPTAYPAVTSSRVAGYGFLAALAAIVAAGTGLNLRRDRAGLRDGRSRSRGGAGRVFP